MPLLPCSHPMGAQTHPVTALPHLMRAELKNIKTALENAPPLSVDLQTGLDGSGVSTAGGCCRGCLHLWLGPCVEGGGSSPTSTGTGRCCTPLDPCCPTTRYSSGSGIALSCKASNLPATALMLILPATTPTCFPCLPCCSGGLHSPGCCWHACTAGGPMQGRRFRRVCHRHGSNAWSVWLWGCRKSTIGLWPREPSVPSCAAKIACQPALAVAGGCLWACTLGSSMWLASGAAASFAMTVTS